MAGTETAFLQNYGAIEHATYYAASHHNQAPSASEGDIDVIPVVLRCFASSQTNLSDFKAKYYVTEQNEHTSATNPVGELVRWHHCLRHMSFKKLQLLATLKLIPRELSKSKTPRCATCMYGKMTKTPWRTKGNQKKIRRVTIPGECVSVDQL